MSSEPVFRETGKSLSDAVREVKPFKEVVKEAEGAGEGIGRAGALHREAEVRLWGAEETREARAKAMPHSRQGLS